MIHNRLREIASVFRISKRLTLIYFDEVIQKRKKRRLDQLYRTLYLTDKLHISA